MKIKNDALSPTEMWTLVSQTGWSHTDSKLRCEPWSHRQADLTLTANWDANPDLTLRPNWDANPDLTLTPNWDANHDLTDRLISHWQQTEMRTQIWHWHQTEIRTLIWHWHQTEMWTLISQTGWSHTDSKLRCEPWSQRQADLTLTLNWDVNPDFTDRLISHWQQTEMWTLISEAGWSDTDTKLRCEPWSHRQSDLSDTKLRCEPWYHRQSDLTLTPNWDANPDVTLTPNWDANPGLTDGLISHWQQTEMRTQIWHWHQTEMRTLIWHWHQTEMWTLISQTGWSHTDSKLRCEPWSQRQADLTLTLNWDVNPDLTDRLI